jgi:hypothetical protein
MSHQTLLPFNFYHPFTSSFDIYNTPAMFSKLVAFSTVLGLLAALPSNAAEFEVVAGGPDGLIQYNPSFIVRRPYIFPS